MLRLNLRAKLLLGVLLILAPTLGLLFYGFESERVRRRDEVLNSLTQTGQAVAVAVDATFDEVVAVGQALAGRSELRSLEPSQSQEQLRQLTDVYPQYENLSLWDASGNNIASVAPVPGGEVFSIRDQPFFERLLATGQPQVSDVFVGRILQRQIVLVAVPVRDQQGATVGALNIVVDMETALASRLERVGLRPGQSIVLTDQTGRLAFHTAMRDVSWEDRDLSAAPEVQAALGGQVVQTDAYRSPLLGAEARAAAFVPTPTYGWVVGVTWPVAQAFAPTEETFRLQLLAFAAIAVLSAIGALLLAAYLLGPVGRLAAQARALGRGELTRRVDIKTGDELEELGRTFNIMAERLQSTLGAVETRAEELGAVATAARALVRELDMDAVARVVVEQARSALDIERSLLWLVDAKGGALRLMAHLGLSPEAVARLENVPLGATRPSAQAARTGEVVVVDDLLATREFPQAQESLAEEGGGARAILAVPLTIHGRVVGVLGLATRRPRRFAAEHLRLAAALGDLFAAAVENARLYEQVREALRVRDEFLTAAVHELRTPATSLKGYVQLLQRRPPHDELEQRALGHIAQAADRAARLARELVEAYGLEKGPMQLKCAALDLTELVVQRVRAVQAMAERHRFLVCAAGPVLITADRERLALALGALLENAVRYQPQGGAVHVTAAGEGGEAMVEVRDFGVGIPDDRLRRAFEPLFEPWLPGSPHYVGVVGLGLYLARRIAEAHGGRIEAESRVGEGSAFRIHLPMDERACGPEGSLLPDGRG